MNNDNLRLASNIKVLRIEARLSIEEFAERAGVSIETVKAWENATLKLYTKDLMVICPILRISEEDILERDIALERNIANKKMKASSSRKDYDWYYGSRSKFTFYLLATILIPLVFIIVFFSLKGHPAIEEALNYFEANGFEPNFFLKYYYVTYSYLAAGICGSVFMIIEIIKRFKQYFRLWYIFLIISFSSLIICLFMISLIPYYVFCLYQLIIKRGRN